VPLKLAEREGTRTLRMGVTHLGRRTDRCLSHQRPLRCPYKILVAYRKHKVCSFSHTAACALT